MADNIITEKKPAAPPIRSEDLSREIELSMHLQPNERIKIIRVFGDCYRCNLWTEEKSKELFWLASGVIRESRFIRATRTPAGVLIEDLKANR